MSHLLYRFAFVILLGFSTSCTLSLSQQERVEHILPTPNLTSSEDKAFDDSYFVKGNWPKENWWEQYCLSELNSLIEKALVQNPTIQGVEARVQFAKSQAVIARSSLMPLIYFDASDQWQYLSENGLYRALNPHIPLSESLIDFSLSYSYEFDFWGKYRNLYRAALSQERAAIAETAQAKLITSTALAQSYFALRTNLLRKKLFDQLFDVRKNYFDLQTKMLKNSLYSKLVPLLSEEAVFQAKQMVYNIEQEIEVNKHIVNILAGQGPDTPLSLDEPLIALPEKLAIPSDISMDLLARRPDLMAQIWRVDALAREVGAAKADFWPNINIAGILGFQSGSWSKLFEWASKTVSVIPGLSLPVYTAGAIGANVDAKKAQFDEEVYRYNDLILQSFNSVADLLAIGRFVYGEKEKQLQIVDNAKARFGLTLHRMDSGIDTRLTAYRVQEEFIQKKLEDVELLFQQYVVNISLVKALGGGYFCKGSQP
jgi:NodT family efflux transporter outer membrane factor (OMF) lipoprotein